MVKLIADSGSTKTDWVLLYDNQLKQEIKTAGINPFHHSHELINETINKLYNLLEITEIESIDFYGAGCSLPEKKAIIHQELFKRFNKAEITIESDLYGAAKAVCQGKAGIACILGTGSNSCQYDGEKILSNTPSLGYILGDEGSGAYLGKRFLHDCLKGKLSKKTCQTFFEETGLNQSIILDKVYREPLANRFLASLSYFLINHRKDLEIKQLLYDCFTDFFLHNIVTKYDTTLPIHFVGSVAYLYQEEISHILKELGLKKGNVMQTPMEGLLKLEKK